MIDLGPELTVWLSSPAVQETLREIVRQAVRAEVRAALDDELVDVAEAAAILNMTEGALRKAVERGQVPCVRVGRRLRFRRSELIQAAR